MASITPSDSIPTRAKTSRGLVSRLTAWVFERLSMVLGLVILLVIVWIAVQLFLDSAVTRGRYGWGFLVGMDWDVPHEVYGALPYIFGTIVSALLALLIAVPLSVGSALL